MKFGQMRAHQVSAEDSHDADHHARVDPVVKMRAPADDELREARISPNLVVIQKRLLGKVVRASRAGIKLCHLRITDCGCQAEQQGEHNACPHGGTGCAGRRLDVEGEPQECTGSDERHGIHRQAGQAQSFLHFNGSYSRFVGHPNLLVVSSLLGVDVCGCAPAGSFSGRSVTFIGTERRLGVRRFRFCLLGVVRFQHEHQAGINRRLSLHELATAALEEVLIRIVMPVLKARDQMTGELAFDGSGELVQVVVKRRAGGQGHHDR